ncbi:hypothetical protein WJX73_008157 [Symbiochloris irregularis]|uniref:Magnesium transporter n=1 Tax=Symbiochloris irregularis TaxID=706552 RepID=A0AAW1NX28_9CHLO
MLPIVLCAAHPPQLFLIRRRQSHQLRWQVLELHSNGYQQQVTITPDQMGLSPRDISIFAESKLGKTSERASIVPRNGAILFRSEIVKSIVRGDRLWLFKCRREQDTQRVMGALYAAALDQPQITVTAATPEISPQTGSSHFRRATGQQQQGYESDLEDNLHSLLPIQRALTEMHQDVLETQEAIQECMDNPNTLAGICLSDTHDSDSQASSGAAAGEGQAAPHVAMGGMHWQPSPSMRAAAGLLESYERQILNVLGAIREMQSNMDVVRDVWGMQLDATRNRIIRIELLVACASLSVMFMTIPGALFGANIPHGFEEVEGFFWPMVYSSIASSVGIFALLWAYWRLWPNRQHRRRVGELRALRRLLSYHMDDLEDVVEALRRHMHHTAHRGDGGAVSQKEFGSLVHRVIRGRVDPEEVDLLYRIYDRNADGAIWAGELAHAERQSSNPKKEADNGKKKLQIESD